MNSEPLSLFRAETRRWLEQNCPPAMREPPVEAERCHGGRNWVFFSDDQRVWFERMVERGWTVPHWPREYGGAGLSPEEARVLREEMDALGCRPPLERVTPAIGMLGPTLLRYGTEAQKREHLAPIARGEMRWCQGYSEPNAGSDLVALQTRADLRGDHFLVNGQKIWTSYADKSDWIFMLVRTDAQAPRHQGISFLLADMRTPGIDTRPITMLSGRSHFCETFFSDVRVPAANLVGEIHQGWAIGKHLLTLERETVGTARNIVAGTPLGVQAAQLRGGPRALAEDPGLRAALAQWEIDAWAFAAGSERAAELARAEPGGTNMSSALKYLYSELNQRRFELLMAAGGSEWLEWEGERSRDGEDARAWLRSKANSIEGGTTEIQLNIIARRVLGLPGA